MPSLHPPAAAAPACVKPALLPPIPCRDDFAIVAQRWFSVLGHAAEVGVWRGDFSARNLQHWRGEYAAVDTWNFRPGDPTDNDKNYKFEEVNDRNYAIARDKIAFAGSRARQVRNDSLSAAATFADGHFDWLYIDARHTYDAVMADLRAWWPKLRPGGLLSGDDYGDEKRTPLLSVRRYAARPKSSSMSYETFRGYPYKQPKLNHWGVVRATQEWAAAVNATLHVTWMPDCYPWPAWYMIKPGCSAGAANAPN